jgi:CRP-like cAMP-binding protein
MLHRTSAISRLRDFGWLAATPSAFRDAVLDRCTIHDYDKGDWVYRTEQPGDGLWGVSHGGVHVEFTQGSLTPRVGIFGGAGFWTGEGSLLAGEPRTIGIRTTRPTRMLHLSHKSFLAVANEIPDAWRWVGLLTFMHMVNLIGLREDLCLRDPEARVIATLVRMTASHWGGPPEYAPDNGEGVALDLNQSELAEMCNVSRAFMAQVLADLKRSGLVEPGYGSIHIPDPSALRRRVSVEQ